MPDVVSPKKRSQMMAGIKGRDTNPELVIRRGLHAAGFRFRLHGKDLPGKPDLVFKKYDAVIFVNGCFWHKHDCHLFKWPQSRPDFWKKKIEGTVHRDIKVRQALDTMNWRYLTVWECALKGKTRRPIEDMLDEISDWLYNGHTSIEIRGYNGTCGSC